MDVRPYAAHDRAACVAVFDSLTPALLDANVRPQFESWLENPSGPYFVMEHDGSIVGCGGYTLSPDGATATLEWGMIRADTQKVGLGRFLLMYRIREIGGHGTVAIVLANPPHASAGFFEKQGFHRGNADPETYIKKLTVCH